jgi:hypothetical protein
MPLFNNLSLNQKLRKQEAEKDFILSQKLVNSLKQKKIVRMGGGLRNYLV